MTPPRDQANRAADVPRGAFPPLSVPLLTRPEVQQDPRLVRLASYLMLKPDDHVARRQFWQMLGPRMAQGALSGNPYISNIPGRQVQLMQPGDIELGRLVTANIPVGTSIDSLMCGVLIVGPTGAGKSTVLRRMVRQMRLHNAIVILPDRKREHSCLLNDDEVEGFVVVLSLEDIKLSLYQHIVEVPQDIVDATTSELIARGTGLISSHRILHDRIPELHKLFPAGSGIPLPYLIEDQRRRKEGGWRAQDRHESVLLALQHIHTHLGSVFAYSRSTFLEVLLNSPGIYIIELPTLPVDMHQFLIGYIVQLTFLQRVYKE